MTDVQRVDFVAVPTRDRDRAEKFYAETLGLRTNPLLDPDGNGLAIHRRYAPDSDGSMP